MASCRCRCAATSTAGRKTLQALEQSATAERTKSPLRLRTRPRSRPVRPNAVAGTTSGLRERKLTPREEAIDRIDELITNANSTTLGFTGFIGLIFVAILLFSTIEGTFNDIWGVTRGRTWFRRILQYWAMITLGPIAMFSVIYLVSTEYFKIGPETLETLPFVGKLVVKALPFVPKALAFHAAEYPVRAPLQSDSKYRSELARGAHGRVGGRLALAPAQHRQCHERQPRDGHEQDLRHRAWASFPFF